MEHAERYQRILKREVQEAKEAARQRQLREKEAREARLLEHQAFEAAIQTDKMRGEPGKKLREIDHDSSGLWLVLVRNPNLRKQSGLASYNDFLKMIEAVKDFWREVYKRKLRESLADNPWGIMCNL